MPITKMSMRGSFPSFWKRKSADVDELADTPVFKTLKSVLQKIVPLNLLDPKAETFAPAYCRTIHDIVRYAHEYSMQEMFKMREHGAAGDALILESELPFKVNMVDLGGGLKPGLRRKAKPDQIRSLPFKAFWEGVSAMRWAQAKPDNVQSISSVFVKTDEQVAQGENPYRDESYVLDFRELHEFQYPSGLPFFQRRGLCQ